MCVRANFHMSLCYVKGKSSYFIRVYITVKNNCHAHSELHPAHEAFIPKNITLDIQR
jgi:hypothetical protein